MTRRAPLPPLEYRDEATIIPKGETINWMMLSDDDLHKLSTGRVSDELMDRCYALLKTKRTAEQEWQTYTPREKAK